MKSFMSIFLPQYKHYPKLGVFQSIVSCAIAIWAFVVAPYQLNSLRVDATTVLMFILGVGAVLAVLTLAEFDKPADVNILLLLVFAIWVSFLLRLNLLQNESMKYGTRPAVVFFVAMSVIAFILYRKLKTK